MIPDIGELLESGKSFAAEQQQRAADEARNLLMQNQPAHGWLWEWVPANTDQNGVRTEGHIRLTQEGKFWGAAAIVAIVGWSVMGGR